MRSSATSSTCRSTHPRDSRRRRSPRRHARSVSFTSTDAPVSSTSPRPERAASAGCSPTPSGAVARRGSPPHPQRAQPGAINPHLLGLTWQGSPFRLTSQGFRTADGKSQHTTQVGGEILVENAQVLQVEYEDGSKTPIPFIFVSKPIAAGFFLYAIPSGHERPGTRVRAVSVLECQRARARAPSDHLPASPPRPTSAAGQHASACP